LDAGAGNSEAISNLDRDRKNKNAALKGARHQPEPGGNDTEGIRKRLVALLGDDMDVNLGRFAQEAVSGG
jgi:hypothetical protein